MNTIAPASPLLSSILSILRYVFGTGLAYAVGRGWIPQEFATEVLAFAMLLVPAIWSVWEKYQTEKKARIRETIGVQAGVAASQQTLIAEQPPENITVDHAKRIIDNFAPTQVKPGEVK